MQPKEEACFCQSCIGTKLHSAIAFIEEYNSQSEGVEQHDIRDLNDKQIFSIASKLRSQLQKDVETAYELRAIGKLQ
jgi:hypothetical protein